jgi:hypothetical protein
VTPAATAPSPHRRRAWSALLVGALGLAALGGTYWFTHEPAPAIRVLWKDEVSTDLQTRLERRYLLSNRRAPHPDAPRSFAYDLLDTRPSNIEALVTDPAVGDTNDVDRQYFEIAIDRASGERWMWAAHRTPMLRNAGVRWTLIVLLAVLAAVGFRSITPPHGGRRQH